MNTEGIRAIYIIVRLIRIRTWMAVLLAVIWMPLMTHCQLESITGLAALHCQATTGGFSGNTHCDDSCCGLETAQYQLPSTQTFVAAPFLAVVFTTVVSTEADASTENWGMVLATSPPKPPRPWQFSLRAALPVRAPSIAS